MGPITRINVCLTLLRKAFEKRRKDVVSDQGTCNDENESSNDGRQAMTETRTAQERINQSEHPYLRIPPCLGTLAESIDLTSSQKESNRALTSALACPLISGLTVIVPSGSFSAVRITVNM